MVIDSQVKRYLDGVDFSNSARINIDQDRNIFDRFSFLIERAKNAHLVHLGFADHIPLIDEKIRLGTWLHKRLLEVATTCIGVDIEREAVETLTAKGIPDLFVHDVVNDPPLARIKAQTWDYLIIGEVLEHIDNPVAFLSEIRKKYGADVRRFIITVPNAWDLDNIRFLTKSVECINTDHRYWFTPYTLAKVCTKAGFTVEDCRFMSGAWPGRKKAFLFRRFPFLQSGLVITLKP